MIHTRLTRKWKGNTSMFISYIELENFNNIETGLGAKKLTIDFTKQTNPVCVISGANGKGKTSLLSYLTPFATLGNLDVRDSNKIIIPGKEGHKLIRLIDNDKNVYEIEHFYHPGKDDSFTVKSYFKFNGEELNENGNVTSFKKLVADMLELEMDYLKLIRMGDNISNLIKSKATERKSFMGKILDSVNIYLKQHKELSLKQRDTKTVISHLIDELSKTKVDDETEIMERIKSLQERIENTNLDIYRWETDITKIKYDIEKLGYTPSSDDVLIRELERKLKAFEKALSKHEEPNTLESVKENIQSTSDRLSSEKVSLELMKKEFEMSMKQLDDAMNQYQSITVQIVKEQEELNIDSLVEHSVELLKKKNELYRSAFDEVDIKCTKDEFDDFVFISEEYPAQIKYDL